MTFIHASLTEIVVWSIIAVGVVAFCVALVVDVVRRRRRKAKRPAPESPWASS
jgi:putative effector of murein hydrolase LrgA (UPF0299 family)